MINVIRNCLGLNIPLLFEINGFEYQIKEVVKYINEGKLQSEIMSWNDSIEVMDIIDNIRGVKHTLY